MTRSFHTEVRKIREIEETEVQVCYTFKVSPDWELVPTKRTYRFDRTGSGRWTEGHEEELAPDEVPDDVWVQLETDMTTLAVQAREEVADGD
jgi:hypothetical protein